MNKLLSLFAASCIFFSSFQDSKAQYVSIPDSAFRAHLHEFFNTCMNGDMLDTTCYYVVNRQYLTLIQRNIKDLTGIQYFDNLLTLDCSGNNLTSLPPLPTTLLELKCGGNKFSSLPPLPPYLWNLYCSGNLLTELPPLPPYLMRLECAANQISSLPVLPSSLRVLNCSFNTINSLPNVLPSTLNELNCNATSLTSLPSLPEQLKILKCEFNSLSSLPALPDSLTSIECSVNQLSSLPDLPEKLTTLICRSNQLKCLPTLPNNLNYMEVADNFITCLPNIPSARNFRSLIKDLCISSSDSNHCVPYSRISGKVFLDINSNGIQETGEESYSNVTVEVQPGNYVTTTDSLGHYTLKVDTGSYTIHINHLPANYYSIVPSAHTANFSNFAETDSHNDFTLQAIAPINDLQVTITPSGMAREGRESAYTIICKNTGTTTLSGTIELTYDTSLIFKLSYPSFTAHIETVLRWAFNDLKPNHIFKAAAYFDIPVGVRAGTDLHFTAIAQPIEGDHTPSDNKESIVHTITGSYDPNLKEVFPTGDVSPEEVAAQHPFTYIVQFQNTGNDTAFVVTIKDTISTNFEIQEIQTLSASHTYSFSMKNGAAIWLFNNILLPDSTTNERLSHGFVKYRIIPKNTLQLNDEIKNTAHIFFDYNPPIQTNTTINRVAYPDIEGTMNADLLEVYPNPSKGTLTINYPAKVEAQVKVTSADGRVVYNHLNSSISQLYINLSSEKKGMYFIQIIKGDQMITKKLVLN